MKILVCFYLFLVLFLGSTSLGQTLFDNAIDFDGNGDFANTLNDPFFPTTNGTLEAWVKVRSMTAQLGNVFFEKNEEQWNLGDFYIFFETSSGKIKARIQSLPEKPPMQADVETNMSFWSSFREWHHIAFTWGNSGMKLFVDGELQANQNSVTNPAMNNTYNFYIGADGYMLHNGNYIVSNFFDGQIDEVRIWNYQKTSEEILALWNSPLDSSYFVTIDSGLVGYWQFDELENLGVNNDGFDDVRDLSVLQNHLDLSGDTHLVPYVTVTTKIFEQTYGGISSDRGIALEVTSDGGYILVGSSSSFGSDQDMYVVKLDSLGILEWSKEYLSPGFLDRIHGVKQTADNNYYFSGYIEGGFGFLDQVILKVNQVGNILWAKHFGGVEADELRDVTVTADGGVLVSGYSASFGGGLKDVQVIKFFSDGGVDWAKNFGTVREDHNTANINTSDGNFLFTGVTDVSGNQAWRPTLIKTDTSGNVIWSKVYSGSSEDWARSAIETIDEGFLISGDTRSYGLGGSQDIYLIKTDFMGEVIWAKAYGGIGDEIGYGVLQDSDGNYVIAGSTNSFGFGGYDAFLMKVDGDGTLLWFHTYGGQQNDYAFKIKETLDGGYALIGARSSNSLGGEDFYLIKTDNDGNSGCDFTTPNVNVFNIETLLTANYSLSTTNNISVADLPLTVITPNTAVNFFCGLVPVELLDFTGSVNGSDVVLKWSTATETNNMGFRIHRDGEEIGFVPGIGTTTEPQNYSFNDDNVENGTYRYSLIQLDYDGTTEIVGEVEIEMNSIPAAYSLQQNYPNPFNPSTIISYSLPENVRVVLKVYGVLGNEVAELVNEIKSPGRYEVDFNSNGLPSGIYFYTIQAGKFADSRKMILLK